nr:T7SS effector LXG polymorphic toxin [Lentibacillus sp. Marseille-P4043]
MKTLDSSTLHEGIDATLKEINHVQSKVTDVQKGVRGIIDLESYLKGKRVNRSAPFMKVFTDHF